MMSHYSLFFKNYDRNSHQNDVKYLLNHIESCFKPNEYPACSFKLDWTIPYVPYKYCLLFGQTADSVNLLQVITTVNIIALEQFFVVGCFFVSKCRLSQCRSIYNNTVPSPFSFIKLLLYSRVSLKFSHILNILPQDVNLSAHNNVLSVQKKLINILLNVNKLLLQ